MAASHPTSGSRADWYADPQDPEQIRYWDGQDWTLYALPTPAGWESTPSGAMPWWQTWWAVMPGLLLCIPFGLVGLWRRPGLQVAPRAALTVASVVFFAVAVPRVAGDSPAAHEAPPALHATDQGSSEDAGEPEPESEPAVMPDLVGLTRKQAERRLTDAGLTVSEVRTKPSPRARNTVLRQSEEAGDSLVAGSTIVLVVAAPYPRVPNVVGAPKKAGLRQLRQAGFRVQTTTETRTSGKNGVVLRQTPAATARAKPGSSITLVIASVVRPVTSPPVQSCTPGYSPCLPPASDYDCAGGSGDGPAYAYGPIQVNGSDPYDLDRDGDGIACES